MLLAASLVATSFVPGAAGIALGIAFVVAGATKIAAGPEWPAEAADLGTPRQIAVAVPWVEIVVGALVATRVAAPLGAVTALVLLVAFTALLVARLRDGDRPPCACFGSWSTRPLSWWHVARNTALMALAALALAG